MGETGVIDRRRFLVGGTGLAVATGVGTSAVAQEAVPSPPPAPKPLPAYVAWKDPEALIVHSNQTIETRRGAIGTSLVTDEDRLYVRNNVSPPPASILNDREGWQVEIAGVRQARVLTVAELRGLGLATVATVLQCSGNGRKYYQDKLTGGQKIAGTPWTVGAAGCVIWSGVPLRAVVDALGGADGEPRFVTGTGGEDVPSGLKPKDVIVERSVPISNLETIILAWEMNGKPLSLAHGGPLRMIVPGYSGVNNIKYVKTIALTERETDAKIQASGYRMHGIGERGSPTQPSVWEQPVRSWITAPLETAKAGRQQIIGVAFGGMNAIAAVEVSIDGGATWRKAAFVGPDLGRFAWRTFVLAADLPPGQHVLASRATDASGNVQPEETEPNGGGYSHNGWRGPALTIEVA